MTKEESGELMLGLTEVSGWIGLRTLLDVAGY